MIERCFYNVTKFVHMAESYYYLPFHGRNAWAFSFSFVLAFAVLFIVISVSYLNPSLHSKCIQVSANYKEYEEDVNIYAENRKNPDSLKIKPFSETYQEFTKDVVYPDFLPEVSDLEPSEDLIRINEVPQALRSQRYKNEGTEQEAVTAMNMALKLKNAEKFEKAQKLFQHALALQPLHPDILNHYGEFVENEQKDIIRADHLYVRALTVSPQHSRALVNRKRTSPVVDDLDDQELEKIDQKRLELIGLNHQSSSVKRLKKEIYFQHIYHTVAIEGNTMTLADTRTVVETRMSVPGKSIMEHNEILGLESALRYLNKTLVNKNILTIFDILEIHKRVLGHVDPIEAGSFRQTQVFVGDHMPPIADDVTYLMEDFVEWLQSDGMLQLHPVKQAALAHYKFVYIHPFVDGNGRTARLLMNLILMRNGYPPVIIRKQDRSMYYNAIQLANEGDVRPFVRFIAQCTECTLNVYLHSRDYGSKCFMALEDRFNKVGNILAA